MAGLVLDQLERVAEVGDEVTVDGIHIEVTEIDGYAIEEVRIQVDPEALGGVAGDDATRSETAGPSGEGSS